MTTLGWIVFIAVYLLVFYRLISELKKAYDRIETLQELCSATYVMAGKVGAPERFLDALVAGANGEFEDLGPEVLNGLVPVRLEEFDTKQLYWDLNTLGDHRPVDCRYIARKCFDLPSTKG
jgi:hypothetical protein